MKIPIFDYIYLWIYRRLKSAKQDDPAFSALLFFVLALGGIVTYIIRKLNLTEYIKGETEFRILLLLLLGSVFFTFFYKKRYIKIEERFSDELKRKKTIRSILVIMYFAFSIYGYFGT